MARPRCLCASLNSSWTIRISVKIRLGNLKKLLELVFNEAGGGTPMRTEPFIGSATSPSTDSREQIRSLGDPDPEAQEDDELPPHLREPIYDKEDCYGPVPPVAEDPYVQADPFAQDWGIHPTSNTRRG